MRYRVKATLGAEVVLANTYHLYLQPGEAVVREAGGLAQFMGWHGPSPRRSDGLRPREGGPTITDSGGFQVFSLGAIIASMHNVKFILDLVSGARHAILGGRFDSYRADFIRDYYG